MAPLNVCEWLEKLRLSSDIATADFAGEALEAFEWEEAAGFYWDMKDDLEKTADRSFAEPFRLVEFFTDKFNLLAELADTLDQAGFKGDTDDALKEALDELTDLRLENEALKAPEIILPDGTALEFDL